MQWPLVERDTHLEDFLKALDDVGQSSSRLLLGAAGTGKSRLLREMLDAAERRGAATESLWATRATCGVPFGVFAHLLPRASARAAANELQLLGALLHRIHGLAEGGRLVLAVDDAPHLDRGSAVVVERVARTNPGVTLLLTAREDEPVPPSIHDLSKDGLLDRVWIGALSPAGVQRLLDASLDGHISEGVRQRMWQLSQGNPLFLRELIQAGREGGTLRNSAGTWVLEGPLPESKRLVDVVEQRLGWLTVPQSRAVARLAVGGHLSAGLAQVNHDQLENLELRNVVTVTTSGRRSYLALSHPLYEEVVRTGLPRATLQRTAGELAGLLMACGCRRSTDRLTAATWLLEAQAPIAGDLAVKGAREALCKGALRLAERLGRAAVDATGSFGAHLVLGEALMEQGNSDQAEEQLARAHQLAPDDRSSARCLTLRINSQALVAGDPDGALRLGSGLLGSIEDPAARGGPAAALALAAGLVGSLGQVLQITQPVLDGTEARAEDRITCLVAEQTALTWMGRLSEAGQRYAEAQALIRSVSNPDPLAVHWLESMNVERLAYSGRLYEAEAAARDGYRAAIDQGIEPVLGATAAELSLALALRGKLGEAVAVAREGLAHLASGDPVGLKSLLANVASVVAAQAGDATAAQELAGLVDPKRRHRELRTAVFSDWAEAWLLPAGAEAAALAARAGRRAVDAEYRVWGCIMLHDSMRLLPARDVADDLAEAVSTVEGNLAGAMSRHAAAAVERDAGEAEQAAVLFLAAGATLLACEASHRAARLYLNNGIPISARRCHARWALQARYAGARTPELAGSPKVPERLTRRELEIARAAASGRSSAAIADRLVLSVRTVDNHLSSIYRKLQVDGREELRELLEPWT